MSKTPLDWESRVRAYEEQGMTRSDAQGVVDAEVLKLESQPGQPWFSVEVEGDGLTGTWALSEMLEANKDDDHLCAWMRCAATGEKYQGGGGAAPIFIVERFI